jgi:hypothetical protein
MRHIVACIMVFERKDIDLCQICNLQLIYRDGLPDLAVNSSTTWMLPDMDQEKPASDVVASAAVSAS